MEQKVIILDDDEDDLMPLCDYLKECGEEFTATMNIDEAIAMATEYRKGSNLVGYVIITDYHMGAVNGFEVMKRVVELNPIVRFIFMSSQPTVPLLLEITTLGIGFNFIDKNQPDFYQRIIRKIGKSKEILGRVMKEIVDRENARIEEENRQLEILKAASDTLKLLNKHDGERSV